jgi:hypothetical protein
MENIPVGPPQSLRRIEEEKALFAEEMIFSCRVLCAVRDLKSAGHPNGRVYIFQI